MNISLLAIAALMFFGARAGADPQISKLPSGPHLGVMVGFEPLHDRAERADELMQMAIDAGMTIGRAQVDWAELEIAPGVYDAEELNDRLEIAGRGGLHVFVTFSSIDTSELTLPAYLSDEAGAAFDGHLLSDAEIRVPYLAFLDWFVPELAKHNVWGLALGNEVDTPIRDHLITKAEALVHLLTGARRVRELDPLLAVTVTLTGDSNKYLPRFTHNVLSGMDIISINTYCLNEDLTVNTQAEWADVLDRWRVTARHKQIFIQELGCPVGFGGDTVGPFAGRANTNNGSDQIQADFFEYYLSQIASDPQLRGATVFQLFDWSQDLTSIYNEIFAAEGAPETGAIFEEWLATVGLCRWSDTTCRPAWDVFLGKLRTLR